MVVKQEVISSGPGKYAWSVKHWCAATDLSPAYVYELLAEKPPRVKSVKIGGKRLITTSPPEFLASFTDEAG